MSAKWKLGCLIPLGLLSALATFLIAWEFLYLPCPSDEIPGVYTGKTLTRDGLLYCVAILGKDGQYRQLYIDYDTSVEVINGTWEYTGNSSISIHTEGATFPIGNPHPVVKRYLKDWFAPSFDKYQEFSYRKRE